MEKGVCKVVKTKEAVVRMATRHAAGVAFPEEDAGEVI